MKSPEATFSLRRLSVAARHPSERKRLEDSVKSMMTAIRIGPPRPDRLVDLLGAPETGSECSVAIEVER